MLSLPPKHGWNLTVLLWVFFLSSCSGSLPSSGSDHSGSHYYNDKRPKIFMSELLDHFEDSTFRSVIEIGEDQDAFPQDVEKIDWIGRTDNHGRPYDLRVTWYQPDGMPFYSERAVRKYPMIYQSQLNLKKWHGRIPAGQWRVEVRTPSNELLVLTRFYIGSAGRVADMDPQRTWSNADYDITQAPGLVLEYEVDMTVDEDFKTTRRIFKRIKILNEEGRRFAEVFEPYVDGHEIPSVGLAHTILPGGKVVQQKKRLMGVSRPFAPSYSAARTIVMTFPSVEPGAVLEYEINFEGMQPLADGLFYHEMALMDRLPVAQMRYSVTFPEDWDLKYLDLNHHVKPDIFEIPESHQRMYSWTFKDIPPVAIEPDMPPYRDLVPVVIVSTTDAWGPVVAWWNQLTQNKYEITDPMESLVKRLVDGKTSRKEIIKAIYEYVKNEIRYVGFDFGRTVYEPAPADNILQNKYGDCKNQSILLKALLNDAGVEADIGLVRTRPYGPVLEELTGAGEFNHAIVVAYDENGAPHFLDPTGSYFQGEAIPAHDYGADILIVKDDGRFERSVIPRPEGQAVDGETATIVLRMDDPYRVDGKISHVFSGSVDGLVKGIFLQLSKEQEAAFIKKILADFYPSANVSDYRVSNTTDATRSLEVEIDFFMKDLLIPVGDQYVLKLIGDGALLPEYITENRLEPVCLDGRRVVQWRITFFLPEHLHVAQIPEDVRVDDDLLAFHRTYSLKDGPLQMDVYLEEKQDFISAQQYPHFVELYDAFAASLRDAVVLEKK